MTSTRVRVGSGIGAASLFLMTGIANAQTTTGVTTTPGIPDTGSGDIVTNVAILALSTLVAGGAALYLYMSRTAFE